jgi:branched-chain amino acid transport system substrate-binding protein/neutral amino acid transport system substrate-binding protein
MKLLIHALKLLSWTMQLTNKRSRPVLCWSGAIAFLVLLNACQPTTETADQPAPAGGAASPGTEASGEALKIATLLPLTGDLAEVGGPMQESVDLLAETVNACGGVLGQPVEILSEDDETNASAAASAMTKLAEVDRVAAVIGAAGSAQSSAAVDIAVRNQVVQISPSSTSPDFTTRAANGEFNGFWFRTAPPDNFQGNALAQLANDQGFKNVAVLAINNDYGNGLAQAFIPAFKELGGTVVNESNLTLYAPDATTFDSEVTAAFQGNPDAVLIIAYYETGSLILKAAQEQGYLGGDTKILLTDGMKTENLAELVGQSSDGHYIVAGVLGTAPSAAGPGIDQFKQLYTAKFNRPIGIYDANAWDAAAVIFLAAEAAKSNAGDAIKEKISEVANPPGQEVSDVCEALSLVREGQDINYQGASSSVDFNEQGDVGGVYDVWTINDDGKLAIQSTVEVGGS